MTEGLTRCTALTLHVRSQKALFTMRFHAVAVITYVRETS
jgi:hypothetical protein